MSSGGLNIEIDPFSRSGKYELETNEMGKTSMFGIAPSSAGLALSPPGQRL